MSETVHRPSPAATAEPNVLVVPAGISWAAVFAGVALALTVQFLLHLLGVGIGAAAFVPRGDAYAGPGAIASGLWFAFSGVIAGFVGGYVASRLSGRTGTTTGVYHGLTCWAVTTLVVVYLLTTSAGALIGGALGGLSSAVGGRIAASAPTIVADPFADIEHQIRDSIGGNDPAAMRDATVAAVRALVTSKETGAENDRARAVDALARARNIPVTEARPRVEAYERAYRSAIETARKQGEEMAAATAAVVSTAAFFGFFSLVLGAVAAWIGGWYGMRRVEVLSELS
ncbi:PhnA-like protein [Ensifer sp. LCM 4579]|uniref:PhnA-like protein n=1 Tax=Ensifer sp. LCM 4579 TaxID=1848292 RepID=UPI0008DA376F|nr:PhnA-like protein [Ensifer sp. LCM 4579]OHV72797.1 PhnA-like protein [Ensifer sp. LCM 4579]